ncbi:hypothetical protein KR093_001292, partial [Drosophila rubida]
IPISSYGWYRVSVYSQKSGCSNAEVLSKLRRAVAPLKLRCHYMREAGQVEGGATFSFHVDNYQLAAELRLRAHRPPAIGVRVDDEPPRVELTAAYRQKLRQAILSRYDAHRRCLNLCRFYADAQWEGEFCALQQLECLEAVVQIAGQEMPRLRRLLLDNNRLSELAGLRGVEQLLPRLKSISLRHNELGWLSELSVLEKLRELRKLNLKRNPLPLNYEQHVVIMLPQLRKLNR